MVIGLLLEEKIKNQIVLIAQNYDGVERVILFGSRARGDALERSDIDIAIEGKSITENDWLALYFELQEELDTLLSVDVVWFNEASEELKNNIKKEGCVLYDNAKAKTKHG